MSEEHMAPYHNLFRCGHPDCVRDAEKAKAEEARMPIRKQVLDTAADAVLRQRNKSYGEPDEDFQRIAAIWNAMGYTAPSGRPMSGHDVSVLLIGLKMSRLTWNPLHQDSWVDIAGYSACGLETASLQEERTAAKAEVVKPEAGKPLPALKSDFSNAIAAGRLKPGSAHCLALPLGGHAHDRECYRWAL